MAVNSPSSVEFDAQVPCETDAETGLSIGPVISSEPADLPVPLVLQGRYCRLEPLDVNKHLEDLFIAASTSDAASLFRYLPDSPPESRDVMLQWITAAVASADPLFFAVIDLRPGSSSFGKACGRQALMRIEPVHRVIEIGNIFWGPQIARSVVSTEANYLFARYIFDELGFRRYEWKCDSLNQPSRNAAHRFGFSYEGHFRRAVIVRGRSRDTSWFSIIEEEWPALKAAYQAWLDPVNFDNAGQQIKSLAQMRELNGCNPARS